MSHYNIGKIDKSQLLPVYKGRGETLQVLLERVRIEKGLGDTKITYAGRLDPMAEGIVLLLVGNERYHKDTLLGLDKDYQFSILFGVSTDTYDVLGEITNTSFKEVSLHDIELILKNISVSALSYPPYSSKTINGVPLFHYARTDTLPDELPKQSGSIKKIEILREEKILLECLIDKIISDIEKVQGDFRQEKIRSDWMKIKEMYRKEIVSVVTCQTIVTSGSYIRSIAHEVGKQLGIPTLAYSIVRTRVGEFTI